MESVFQLVLKLYSRTPCGECSSITRREWQREIDQIIFHQILLQYTEEIYLRCNKGLNTYQRVLRIDWLKMSPWSPRVHSINCFRNEFAFDSNFCDDAITQFEFSRFFTSLFLFCVHARETGVHQTKFTIHRSKSQNGDF